MSATVEEMIRMRDEENLSMSAVAAKLGVSRQFVHRMIGDVPRHRSQQQAKDAFFDIPVGRRLNGNEIRAVVEDFEISQVELADMLGINDRTMRRWVGDQQEISLLGDKMIKLMMLQANSASGKVRPFEVLQEWKSQVGPRSDDE